MTTIVRKPLESWTSSDGRITVNVYKNGEYRVLVKPAQSKHLPVTETGGYYARQGKVFQAIVDGKCKSAGDLKKVALEAGYKRTPLLESWGYIQYKAGQYRLTEKGKKEFDRIKINTWGAIA